MRQASLYGTLHYYVRDVEAHRRFWVVFGGEPTRIGTTEVVRVPGVTSVFIVEGERLMLFDDSATKLRFSLDDGVDDPVATQGSRGEWRGLRCAYVRGPLGFRIALLTDSWGTYIELTEGRSALD